jgi:hypothetical protein
MGITGNLKTMELAELLQWLASAQKTGTLAVDDGSIQKQIVFRAGRIISTASSDPREHLGAILISHGFITDAELAEAIARQQREKTLIGKVLVDMQAIAERDLYRMLRLKAEESLYDAFTWPEGDFRFHDGQLPPPETLIPLALDVAAVVLEGMQRIDEWRRIRQIIPTDDCVPVVVGEFDESEMAEWDGQVLSHVDDDRSIAEICRLVHASEFYVCKILLRQLQAGRLKIVRARGGTRAEPETAPVVPLAISAELLLEEARQRLAKGELDQALRHARAARALDPDSRATTSAATQVEDAVKQDVDRAAMRPTDVPKLARPFEELSKLRLSPQEGYVLSRIDGRQDLRSLLRLGPMSPLDMQLLLRKLVDAGHVRLDAKR